MLLNCIVPYFKTFECVLSLQDVRAGDVPWDAEGVERQWNGVRLPGLCFDFPAHRQRHQTHLQLQGRPG